jgi:hypothetical protein
MVAGRLIAGRYLLLQEIGSGGYGTVYRARDRRTRRIVAVKVLHPHLAREPQYIRRFLREVETARRLDSRHIVAIFDAGQEGGIYFLVCEFVHGVTLRQLLTTRRRLPWREALSIGVQIARALEEAQDKGVVHRDLKPQNILVTEDGIAKLGDFGIARLEELSSTPTGTTPVIGSPHYVSPEQVAGRTADIRSDIYSLGVILYEMICGRPPFDSDSPWWVVLNMHLQQEPKPLGQSVEGLPPAVEAVVAMCLKKSPEDRFQSPRALRRALEEILHEEAGFAETLVLPGRPTSLLRRAVSSVPLSAVAALAALQRVTGGLLRAPVWVLSGITSGSAHLFSVFGRSAMRLCKGVGSVPRRIGLTAAVGSASVRVLRRKWTTTRVGMSLLVAAAVAAVLVAVAIASDFGRTIGLRGREGPGATTPPPVVRPVPPSRLQTILQEEDGIITLSWLDNSNNEEGFRVERSAKDSPDPSAEGDWQGIGLLPPDASEFRDGPLPPGTYWYRLYAYNSAGRSDPLLAGPFTVPPAPSRLAYVGLDGRLYIFNPDKGTANPITGGGVAHPAWAPDGRRLAFIRVGELQGEKVTQLSLINSDGSNEVTLVARRKYEFQGKEDYALLRNPRWSADGSTIFFNEFRRLAGSYTLQRVSAAPPWQVSSDVLEDPKALFGEAILPASLDVSWAHGHLAYEACREGTPGACAIGLEPVPGIQGTRGVVIPMETDRYYGLLAWSPDGQKIALYAWVGGPGRVMVLDGATCSLKTIATAAPKAVTIDPMWPTLTWSPAGDRIAYEDRDAIWIINADGSGKPEKLADGRHPIWYAPPKSQPLPTGFLSSCANLWRAEFYNNTTLAGNPVLVRCDRDIDFDWGLNSPGPGVNKDNFSARRACQVELEEGIYRFRSRRTTEFASGWTIGS